MKAKLGVTLTGPAGTASQIICTFEDHDDPAWSAGVSTWFLDCPGQSPAWRHFRFDCIHLRPIVGARPPVINLTGSTHEFYLAALDPRDRPVPTDPAHWMILRPINLCEQVIIPNDEAARDVAEACAKLIVEGYLWAEPPLSGQYEPWRTQLQLLAEHSRGEHAKESTRLQ